MTWSATCKRSIRRRLGGGSFPHYGFRQGNAIVETERYNKFRGQGYPCPHKGCQNKLWDGGCSLHVWRMEVDEGGRVTGKCLDFTSATLSNHLHLSATERSH